MIILFKHITLPSYTLVQVKMMTIISDIIYTNLSIYCRQDDRVRPANEIYEYEVVANKSFGILLTLFSAVEKKLHSGMVTSYASKSSAIHLPVT